MKRRKNLINLGVVPAPLCRQKGDEDKAEPLCCQIRSKQKILGPFQMRRLLQSSGPHAGSDLGTYSTQLLCPAVTQEVCAAKPFSLPRWGLGGEQSCPESGLAMGGKANIAASALH